MQDKLRQLKERLAEVRDLEMAAYVLRWDQQVNMPPGGAAARAEQIATLERLAHEKFTSDEVGRLLQDLQAGLDSLDPDSDDAGIVRTNARDYERKRRVPAALVAEIGRASAIAFEAWVKARENSDFAMFAPHLEKMFDLARQVAEHRGYTQSIYDPLLDEFEPGMKAAEVRAIFADLRQELVALLKAISSRLDAVDDACLRRDYEPQKQWDFGLQVIKQFGYDFERGRQDKSAHPFTTAFSTDDVRLTTRIDPRFLNTALFSTLHECGHGLYEQGVSPTLARTRLDDGASYGLHESQSRLWENIVGRSRGFWVHYFPRLKATFPETLNGVDLETFYRAVNKVEPSLIRVEADEVTYNLHIMLRFELEQDLLEGRVPTKDLPEAWRAKMQDYLGIAPANDAEGVLQDVHWSGGAIGYFPTYALGTLMSAQLYDAAVAERPSIPSQIEAGEFGELLAWLREKVHRHGRKYLPGEILERATGRRLDAGPYLRYLQTKYREIYQL